MSHQEVFVQEFAKLFAHYQHALSDCARERDSAVADSWREAPSAERQQMLTAAHLALVELESHEDHDSRRWFARPGQAEWGC
jgi:hypothetical protein